MKPPLASQPRVTWQGHEKARSSSGRFEHSGAGAAPVRARYAVAAFAPRSARRWPVLLHVRRRGVQDVRLHRLQRRDCKPERRAVRSSGLRRRARMPQCQAQVRQQPQMWSIVLARRCHLQQSRCRRLRLLREQWRQLRQRYGCLGNVHHEGQQLPNERGRALATNHDAVAAAPQARGRWLWRRRRLPSAAITLTATTFVAAADCVGGAHQAV